MDLSCIISSGDLELYVLGLLPEEEASKIAQLAALFPEIREEIDAITATLAGTASAMSPGPGPSLRSKVLDRLSELKNEKSEGPARVVPLLEEEPAPAPVVSLPSRRSPLYWSAAAIIGFIVCTGILISLTISNNATRRQVAVLQSEVDRLRTDKASGERALTAYRSTVAMMQSADFAKVNLTEVPGKPKAMAQVLWNKTTGDVYLADVSLPGVPAGRQYQLWAIVDGKPVDAGLLGGEKGVAQKMKRFPKADMFAITLEKAGGSPAPTMTEMYVMGKV